MILVPSLVHAVPHELEYGRQFAEEKSFLFGPFTIDVVGRYHHNVREEVRMRLVFAILLCLLLVIIIVVFVVIVVVILLVLVFMFEDAKSVPHGFT